MPEDVLVLLEIVGLRPVMVEGLGHDVVIAYDVGDAYLDASLDEDGLRITADWILARAAQRLGQDLRPQR